MRTSPIRPSKACPVRNFFMSDRGKNAVEQQSSSQYNVGERRANIKTYFDMWFKGEFMQAPSEELVLKVEVEYGDMQLTDMMSDLHDASVKAGYGGLRYP